MELDYSSSKRSLELRRICKECGFWYPHDLVPSLGECKNEKSMFYENALHGDKVSADCFVERSFSNLDFCWCSKCRETVPVSELSLHSAHDLYVSTAPLSVEDMMETTLAGD